MHGEAMQAGAKHLDAMHLDAMHLEAMHVEVKARDVTHRTNGSDENRVSVRSASMK
jgi:hypothetical protein